MAHKSIPQPAARTFSVAELVELAQAGKIQIPKFQRPLRWHWDDVRRLFDSISKGYPIGSLLLWKRDAKAGVTRLGALTVDAGPHPDALWVVDGQQRLTSLASALSSAADPKEEFSLAYDVQAASFVRVPRAPVDHIVPLPVLFDLKRLLKWAQDHPDLDLDEAGEMTKSIRQFAIPAYIVEQQDEAVLRDIFDRMNNYGKRLSRAEVFAALHPGSDADDKSSWFERIITEVDVDLRFGRLDDDTVLRAVLARRGPDVTREIRDEFGNGRKHRDFGGESEEEAYRQGGLALQRSVQFLIDIGIPHVAFLPYRYLLIVLTRFFAHFDAPHPRNIALLRRWFWRASLIGPNVYSGSWNHAMRTLAGQITPGNESGSVQALLGELDQKASSLRLPNLQKFRTNQADSRVALCALWDLKPRAISTGEPYSREDLADALGGETSSRVVLARAFSSPPDAKATWFANRYFDLEGARIGGSGDQGSGVLPPNEREIFLASHGLTEDLVGLWARNESDAFLDARQALLDAIVRDFVARSAEQKFEDTPPLDDLDLDEDDDDEFPR